VTGAISGISVTCSQYWRLLRCRRSTQRVVALMNRIMGIQANIRVEQRWRTGMYEDCLCTDKLGVLVASVK